MTFHTSARTARLLPVGISMLAIALTPTAATAEPNPPKVQKELEAAARAMTRSDYGVVVRTGATVEDHMLIINFEPALGTKPETAIMNMQETNWNQGICANKNALAFIDRDGITVQIRLTPSGKPSIVIFDVTSASCKGEAAAGSHVSRIIGGVSFAPPPTQDEALVKIQSYIQQNFKDPDSAVVKCGDVSKPAWVKRVLTRRRFFK